MHRYKISKFTTTVPIEYEQAKCIALFHTLTKGFFLVPEAIWTLLKEKAFEKVNTEIFETIREGGIITGLAVDETAVFETWKQQHVHDYSRLTSKILVTRRCNNRCRYCILDHKAADMSAGTARAMDNFYFQTIKEKHPEKVEDDFLGGEPLLNTRVILECASRRLEYCRREDIEYGFTLTTNGTLLTPKIVRLFKKAGLADLRVSMAGSEHIHDKLRPAKSGGKTYDIIIKNLRSISGLVPVTIECQYDSGSDDYEQMPEMLDDFKRFDLEIEDIFFTPILPKRGDNSFSNGMGAPRIALWLQQLARSYGYNQTLEPPANLCKADFRSSFVFDTDGSIIPCPSLRQGEMAYGDVLKGVDFVSESQLLFRRLPEKCLKECPLLPICMGGCRLQALTTGNDFCGIDCQYDTFHLFLEDYIRQKAREALIQVEN